MKVHTADCPLTTTDSPRHDPILARTVLVAANRRRRPHDFQHAEASLTATSAANCPFCAGNESKTPAAVLEIPGGQQPWQIRVVPNKYPAVGLDDEMLAPGVQEVIIESSRHLLANSQLSVAEVQQVLATYQARLAYWQADGRFRYATVFKNVGPAAGASLAHLHSQFVALPAVPPLVQREIEALRNHQRQSGTCAFCERVATVRADRTRLVVDTGPFLAFCPYASEYPYELWIVPTTHEPEFRAEGLACVLHDVLGRLERTVPKVSYNLLLSTSPWPAADVYHWRIEICPRLAIRAGLEMTSGVTINQVAPERAAQVLRDAASN